MNYKWCCATDFWVQPEQRQTDSLGQEERGHTDIQTPAPCRPTKCHLVSCLWVTAATMQKANYRPHFPSPCLLRLHQLMEAACNTRLLQAGTEASSPESRTCHAPDDDFHDFLRTRTRVTVVCVYACASCLHLATIL
jgi:hypothetical protein